MLSVAGQVDRRRPGRPTPWFDTDCCAAHRHCHRLERRYHRTHDSDDRQRWVQATHHRFALYRQKKEQYWSDRLLSCGRRPRIGPAVALAVANAWT